LLVLLPEFAALEQLLEVLLEVRLEVLLEVRLEVLLEVLLDVPVWFLALELLFFIISSLKFSFCEAHVSLYCVFLMSLQNYLSL